MLMDIHTHVFPPQLAQRAIHHMTEQMRDNYDSFHVFFEARADGTAAQLLQTMDESGCNKSVLCPVVTNAKSTKATNDYAWSLKSHRLIPFASFLPTEDSWEQTLEAIAEQGFQGIKLHPEFQGFDVDSPRSIQVVKRAEALGLAIVFHAGKDPGYPPPAHSTPLRMARLLEQVDGRRIVATHLGGWLEWEDVERYLTDAPIYFDTACISAFINPAYCKHIIRSHGTDKIVFGSDYPWQTSGDVLAFLRSLDLTEEELEAICWNNAQRLLSRP